MPTVENPDDGVNTPPGSGHSAEKDETLAQVYVLLRRHEVWGYNGSEIACRCDRKWRSLHDHAEHHAGTLIATGVILPPGDGRPGGAA